MPEKSETFVCAHELGHAIYHHDINTPFLKANTLFSTAKIEREANIFAVELLMPDDLLRENTCNIYSLADAPSIPHKLAELKLQN
ncbi:ImmA/IrrE family metallo-endopeptidase [Sporomusa carbonis]|uniref:ImmA/IrrE family metallo-endopeptidase n=1 Tax=Sporomusa carbonis TaxID=3076075 RepID=UPI003C7B3D83